MIWTVHIDKEVPGIYLARACLGFTEVGEAQTYQGIEAAIRGEALRAEGYADFPNVTYGGMSTGTFPVHEVPAKATDLTHRLVYLKAQMHEILSNAGSAGRKKAVSATCFSSWARHRPMETAHE